MLSSSDSRLQVHRLTAVVPTLSGPKRGRSETLAFSARDSTDGTLEVRYRAFVAVECFVTSVSSPWEVRVRPEAGTGSGHDRRVAARRPSLPGARRGPPFVVFLIDIRLLLIKNPPVEDLPGESAAPPVPASKGAQVGPSPSPGREEFCPPNAPSKLDCDRVPDGAWWPGSELQSRSHAGCRHCRGACPRGFTAAVMFLMRTSVL